MTKVELPGSWSWAELDQLARFQNGRAFNKREWKSHGLPIIRIQNLNARDASFNYSTEEHEPQFKVRHGDLLFAWAASLGVYVWHGADAWLNQHIFLVSPEAGVEKAYLFYLLTNTIADFYSRTRGSGMVHITKGELVGTSLPLPPLNEQKRIVAKIEELFSELDAGEESLRKARRQLGVYRQALLKQAFKGKLTEKWREKNSHLIEYLDDLLHRIQAEREGRFEQQLVDWENGGRKGTKPAKPKEFESLSASGRFSKGQLPTIPDEWHWLRLDQVADIGSGMSVSKERTYKNPVEVPYLRVANVQRGSLNLTELKTMQVERDRLDDLRLKVGDILFNEGGDRDKLGRGWVWPGKPDPCITQNHVFRATPVSFEVTESEFISHWGNAFGQDFFSLTGKQTTNLASISKGTLSSLPVPIPHVEEQREILRLLDEQFTVIEQNEREIDTALNHSEVLRQSILKKAFSGQLVAQDSADEPASELLKRIRAERDFAGLTKNAFRTSTKTPAAAPVEKDEWFPDIIPFKPLGKTDLQAGIVALAVDAFMTAEQFMGHTIAEKVVHLADCIADLQLDRNPIKDAAGPNDSKKAKAVETRAKMKGWFTVQKKGPVYLYNRGRNLERLLEDTRKTLGSKLSVVENLLGEMVRFDTEKAEIFATVFAAWNNLLLRNEPITEEAIVTEARENWHPKKLLLDRGRFFKALAWMKTKGFTPKGTGKVVASKKP